MIDSDNIFRILDPNKESFGALKTQLGKLIGSRADLEDICMSSRMNIFARYKSESIDKRSNLTDEDRHANGYGLAVDVGGIETQDEVNIRYINSIYRVVPPIYNRIKDFNGYDHKTRSQLQLSQDVVSPSSANNGIWVWSGPCPNGVPFDMSIESMWRNDAPYSALKISDMNEFGWIAITYSGFVRASGVLSSSFDGLRAILQSNNPQISYTPYQDFLKEPKGRNGKLFVYGRNKTSDVYTQLIAPCLIKNAGSVHPVEISWNPSMTLGTTTTGFNIQVKDWLRGSRKNEYIMFGKDDDLYFGFTIYNNSTSRKAFGSSLKLALTVGNKTYYTWFSDDSSSAFAGSFSVDPLKSYGPYYYPSTGGVIVQRPRFFVQLKSLANIFPEFFNQQKYDVTFSLYYIGDAGGPLETEGIKESGVLVSRFTIPMQCTGKETENPIDPPSDIKPTPPDWDVEVQD